MPKRNVQPLSANKNVKGERLSSAGRKKDYAGKVARPGEKVAQGTLCEKIGATRPAGTADPKHPPRGRQAPASINRLLKKLPVHERRGRRCSKLPKVR